MNPNVRRGRTAVLVALSGVALTVLAGCSSSVSASDVGEQIKTQLKAQNVPIDGDAVTCPEDLPAEVGKTVTCTFTSGGTAVDAEAKVTAVDGSNVNFDITPKPK